jgi:hypothetical protein
MCIECGMIICKDCHPIHDQDHMRRLLRFRTMQWMANLPGVAVSVSCSHCAKDTKVRWQCDKCEYALCRLCAGNFDRRDRFLKDHEQNHPDHRTFLAIYPPYWTTAQRWILDKCPCLDVQPAAVVHCNRCHAGMLIKHRFTDSDRLIGSLASCHDRLQNLSVPYMRGTIWICTSSLRKLLSSRG